MSERFNRVKVLNTGYLRSIAAMVQHI